MFFQSKKLIGLDIGSSSIKLAELTQTRKGAELTSFGFVSTPTNALSAGEIVDPVALGMAIESLIISTGTKNKKVATGMWGTSVIVRKITTQKITDKKILKDQMRFEAEQYIPFDINNISLAYHVLKQSSSPDTMDVLLIAAQNEFISQYADVLQAQKLQLAVLDVSGLALANCYELNYGKASNEVVGLFNIGSSVTNFVVIRNGEVVFSRDIPVGGQTFTNEIHKNMGVTIQEAESLKLSAASQSAVPDDVHNVINMTNEVVAEEIRNSIEYLSATTEGATLTRAYVTGGGAFTPGLVESISRVGNVNLQFMNPFNRIYVQPKKFSPSYVEQIRPYSAVALGLALRQAGDS